MKKIKAENVVFSPETSKRIREFFGKKPRTKEEPAPIMDSLPRGWKPEDGVIFPKVEYTKEGVCQIDPNLNAAPVPDIAEPTEISEFLVSSYGQSRRVHSNPIEIPPRPTDDERYVSSLKIQARQGSKHAQQRLTERFGPMNRNWSEPLPVQPRMNLWQRILFVFRGYND